MKQYYELWLDESGNFEGEAAKKGENENPSLIGGLLLPRALLSKVPYAELLGDSLGHACKMKAKDKTRIILPALEKLQALGARQVFFENSEYEDERTNRQLYLRMMAEGLVQLLQTLNATNESISLHVIIAQRQDVTMPAEQRRIQEEEYIATLKRCMAQKSKERHIVLDEDTTLAFEVRVAACTEDLKLADFACNTRLTRQCKVLRNAKERVDQLYTNAYLFTLHEQGTAQYIKTALAQGNISDAIIELYTTKDTVNETIFLDMVRVRMQTMGYRLIKSQLKQCAAELVAYASKLEDYEIGEAFLNKLNEALIPFLEENDFYADKLQFQLLLLLSDMYLREGDTAEARRVLADCRATHLAIEASLEEVFGYYQLLEKEALLCINEFDFEAANQIMERACNSFLSIMGAIEKDAALKQRFAPVKSEYFGDALCMQIYAQMFLQRENPDCYADLCELSDLALAQYSGAESELERHRQYRAHIACEAHQFGEALNWLFLSKCYHADTQTKKDIVGFLDAVHQSEAQGSCEYYMMYYLHIMSEAALQDDPLAPVMHQALHQQHALLITVGLNELPAQTLVVDLTNVQLPKTDISYHPTEIVYWKYATYFFANKQYKAAHSYYSKAIEICNKYQNYTTMRLTGIGVLAEFIVALIDAEEYTTAQHKCTNLKKHIAEMQQEPISDAASAFLSKAEALVAQNSDRKGIAARDALWALSRLITY